MLGHAPLFFLRDPAVRFVSFSDDLRHHSLLSICVGVIRISGEQFHR